MFPNIQILRGFAAIMVVLFHVVLWLPPMPDPGPLVHRIFHDWGKSGVDLFFVISGFVIMLSQSRNHRRALPFLRNRALRILPLYWLLTLGLALILMIAPQLLPGQPQLDARRLVMSLGMVDWLVLREFPVIFVGWTLEYEMLFYAIFALACGFLPLGRVPWAIGAVFLVAVLLGALEQMVLEFVTGMAIARLRLARDRLPGATLIFLAGAVLFVMSIWYPVGPRLLHWGLPSAMIVTGLIYMRQLGSPIWDYLGNASYAIYLGQALAIPAAQKLVVKLVPDGSFTTKALLIAALTVVLGCLLHSLVERPLNRFLQPPPIRHGAHPET